MVSQADMVKRVSGTGTGVLTNKTPDLFTRHGSRFHGYASFDGKAGVLLEVADTSVLKTRGLMGRKSMPACCGMIFTDLTGGAFWMKGCMIPLDIVFIGDTGKVTRLYTMQADGGKERYGYDTEKTAIELAAGFCHKHGIRVGTLCTWRTW